MGDENDRPTIDLIAELESEEVDPLIAEDSEGMIVAGERWETKCLECIEFIMEEQGQYAECSLQEKPQECEGPHIFVGEEWTSTQQT
jgi:hypothetical protein